MMKYLGHADEVELAHNSLKALVLTPSNGPISCTVIFGLLAQVGPKQPESNSMQALVWALSYTIILRQVARIGPSSTQ